MPKDIWDKISSFGGIASGLLIAAVGGVFTYNYNLHQLRIEELKVAEALSSSLAKGSEAERRAILATLVALGSVRTVAQLAELYPDSITVRGLASYYRNGSSREASIAAYGLGRVLLEVVNSKKDEMELIEGILASGIHPDAVTDSRGRTALAVLAHAASVSDALLPNPSLVFLLKRGANPNAQDHEGRTPLVWAIFNEQYRGKKFRLIDPLVRYGARMDIQTKDGDTPFHIAMTLLPFSDDQDQRFFLGIVAGQATASMWEMKDNLGRTPLDNCARAGDQEYATCKAFYASAKKKGSFTEKFRVWKNKLSTMVGLDK